MNARSVWFRYEPLENVLHLHDQHIGHESDGNIVPQIDEGDIFPQAYTLYQKED